MNLASLSIRRPIFISCLVILMLVVGYISLKRLPVDLFPDVTIPVITVRVEYPGAGPEEIEAQVTKPLEDELSSVAGIDVMKSINSEGLSQVIIEFTLDTDVKYAEQQVRARVDIARRRLPDDIEQPEIRTIDPADTPILVVAVSADLPDGQLYDLANEVIKPRLAQVNQVGMVEILGGRKREIQVQLDRDKLVYRELSASQVAQQIAAAGRNIPVGKVDREGKEAVFRAVGEYKDLETIESTIVRFQGNENPITVGQLGRVTDTLADEKSRSFVNGNKALLINIFRQSKANTIAVVDALQAQIATINKEQTGKPGNPKLDIVRDGSYLIRANVYDVNESIIIGIILTVIVVYFFLGSARSTVITGLALPNSLLGAFILMYMAGFSINIMSLLALSLSVGLLIDDAIVVRENIFRYVEMGKDPAEASLLGTTEVTLAVIATTMAILAVFGPIGFLSGVIGQYLKEFGLTICFAMMISLFDALTIAPMLSAYFAAPHHPQGVEPAKKVNIIARMSGAMLKKFDRFQTMLENVYHWLLDRIVLRIPLAVIAANIALFVFSIYLMKYIPKTFLPPQDNGEAAINVDLPPGTAIDKMALLGHELDKMVRKHKEVERTVLTIGNQNGEANKAEVFIKLVPAKQRKVNTTQFQAILREDLKPYAYANPQVSDGKVNNGNGRPFGLNIIGADLKQIEEYSAKLLSKIKNHPGLKDVDTSYRPGKPELQVLINNQRAEMLGIQTATVGNELRTQVQGTEAAIFRQNGIEYDVRVRMLEEQRDLRPVFRQLAVPNINNNLVPLAAFARPADEVGPATILRQNRARYVQLSADVASDGPGMGKAIEDIGKLMNEDLKLPLGVSFSYEGQAKRFGELIMNMLIAMGLGIMFIYLVLASLYESFITPLAIMLVFPLALCGAFGGLFLMGSTLDLFSMIGCVMLLGLATKNSILLVDYANQRMAEGVSRREAMLEAGRTRLRPILMTSFALIAGMVPVAVGLNEASKQRTSLGIAIIGGTISSTLLTLLVVPAAFDYIDRLRLMINNVFYRYIGSTVDLDKLDQLMARPAGATVAAPEAAVVAAASASSAEASAVVAAPLKDLSNQKSDERADGEAHL